MNVLNPETRKIIRSILLIVIALRLVQLIPALLSSHPGSDAAYRTSGRFIPGTIAKESELPWLKEECGKGDLECCHRVGRYYEQLLDKENAEAYYKVACDGNYAMSCHNLGVVESHLGSSQAAYEYWKKACALKFGYSCFGLAADYERAGNMDEAQKWYALACERGDPNACSRQLALPAAKVILPIWKKLNYALVLYVGLFMVVSLLIGQWFLSVSQRRLISDQKKGKHESDIKRNAI